MLSLQPENRTHKSCFSVDQLPGVPYSGNGVLEVAVNLMHECASNYVIASEHFRSCHWTIQCRLYGLSGWEHLPLVLKMPSRTF